MGGGGNTSFMILKSEAKKQTFLKDRFFRIVIIPHLGTFNQLENLGLGNTHSCKYHLHYKALKISLLNHKTKVKKSRTQQRYKVLDNVITWTKKSKTPKETPELFHFYQLQKNYFDFLQLKIHTEIRGL